MDPDELALWIAWYERNDPRLRDDWRIGVLASNVLSLLSGTTVRAVDVFPSLASLGPRRDEAQMERDLMAWCANAGGVVKFEKRKR